MGLISLSASILLTCNVFHQESFVIATPKILDTFNIFEDHSPPGYVKHRSFFYPFPCYLHHIAFDRLKSHTQFPCQAPQLIYIFLKFQCVLCIFNFSVTNSHPQTLVQRVLFQNQCLLRYHLYKENNKGPRIVPYGTPDKIGAQSILLQL